MSAEPVVPPSRPATRDVDTLALLERLLDTMLANYDALPTESRDDYVRGDVLPLRMSTAFWLDLRAALSRPALPAEPVIDYSRVLDELENGDPPPAEHAPPEPSEAAIEAAWSTIERHLDVGGTPNTQIRLLVEHEVKDALHAAYAVDFGGPRPALAGSPDYEALAIEFCQRPLTFSDGIQLSPAAAVREFANWLTGRVAAGNQERKS